jgi:HEAT repeat protein
MILALGGACATAVPEPPLSGDDLARLSVALSDIHRRPRLSELEDRFGRGIEPALISLAGDETQNWLVRGRALEVLAESDHPRSVSVVRAAHDDPTTPASVRRSLARRLGGPAPP